MLCGILPLLPKSFSDLVERAESTAEAHFLKVGPLSFSPCSSHQILDILLLRLIQWVHVKIVCQLQSFPYWSDRLSLIFSPKSQSYAVQVTVSIIILHLFVASSHCLSRMVFSAKNPMHCVKWNPSPTKSLYFCVSLLDLRSIYCWLHSTVPFVAQFRRRKANWSISYFISPGRYVRKLRPNQWYRM